MARDWEFRHVTVQGDPSNAVAGGFREPDAVVAGHYRQWPAAWCDAVLELGDRAGGRDAADFAGVALREPDVPVRADQRAVGTGVGGWKREERNRALRGDAADLVCLLRAEPHIAVRAWRDSDRHRGWLGQGELIEGIDGGIEPTDLGGPALAEPQLPVGAFDADIGLRDVGGNAMEADGRCNCRHDVSPGILP